MDVVNCERTNANRELYSRCFVSSLVMFYSSLLDSATRQSKEAGGTARTRDLSSRQTSTLSPQSSVLSSNAPVLQCSRLEGSSSPQEQRHCRSMQLFPSSSFAPSSFFLLTSNYHLIILHVQPFNLQ